MDTEAQLDIAQLEKACTIIMKAINECQDLTDKISNRRRNGFTFHVMQLTKVHLTFKEEIEYLKAL